jgi:acetate kinase
VFTAGIGENDVNFRSRLMAKLEWSGIKINEKSNVEAHGGNTAVKISAADSKVAVYVIPTNEELMIAQNVIELFNLS